MTQAVYRFEDAFHLLTGRVHWMWWPMIGGLIIGLGGLVEPRALGVGYGTIHAELLGQLGLSALALLFVVKLLIWSAGLGSGTSGGILAPVLMLGAAIGGILGHALPGTTPGVWALIGLAGAMGGVTRSPFTAIIFAFELTHDQNSLLALLVAATISHLVSVLILKRSILTEKVARRGFHVMREYSVDPLEATFVREVMDTDVVTVTPEQAVGEIYAALPEGSPGRRQRLYPVLDEDTALVGLLPWSVILEARDRPGLCVGAVMLSPVALAHPDEVLRTVADRMVQHGLGVLPVVERADAARLVGLVTQFDLLQARQKLLEEERHAERVLTLRRATPKSVRPTPRARGDVSMERAVTGFEQDEAGDWVALLECGHRQHVRHRPPWRERAWVLTAEGRRERIGSPLECRPCDEEQGTGGDRRLLGAPGLPPLWRPERAPSSLPGGRPGRFGIARCRGPGGPPSPERTRAQWADWWTPEEISAHVQYMPDGDKDCAFVVFILA